MTLGYIETYPMGMKPALTVHGGKGMGLIELSQMGLEVPPFWIVNTGAYRKQTAHIKPWLKAVFADIVDFSDTAELCWRAKLARAMVLTVSAADLLEKYASAMYSTLGGHIAVRSSATLEDLDGSSFAGQQTTLLNVPTLPNSSAVAQAVVECWSSLFSDRAVCYRAERGFSLWDVDMAVVLQRQIDSTVSGVAFSQDPNTGEDVIVIEAVYGQGEGLVSGEITPDQYRIKLNMLTKEFKVLEQRQFPQYKAIMTRPKGGTEWVPVPAPYTEKLSQFNLNQIVHSVRKLKKKKGPVDIEFCLSSQNGVESYTYILQCRPLTTGHGENKAQALLTGGKVLLLGSPASKGRAAGPVCTDRKRFVAGDVLVTTMTTPDDVPLMKQASAVVTDIGGSTCHAAIIAREFGIPCVVGTGTATQLLTPRQVITVDGTTGVLYDGVVEERVVRRNKLAVPILANLGELDSLTPMAGLNFDGVGMLRTDAHVFSRGLLELEDALEQAVKLFSPRPVTVRLPTVLKGTTETLAFPGCGLEAISRVMIAAGVLGASVLVPRLQSPEQAAYYRQLENNLKLKIDSWLSVSRVHDLFSGAVFATAGVRGVVVELHSILTDLSGPQSTAYTSAAFLNVLTAGIANLKNSGLEVRVAGRAIPQLLSTLLDQQVSALVVTPDQFAQVEALVAGR